MAKLNKIVLKYVEDGKETPYTLEFNRDSIVKMERSGFNIAKADERYIDAYLSITRGAFIMHHPTLKAEEIDQIINCFSKEDKDSLVEALIDLYKDAVEALNDKGDKKGNATWVRA